MNQQNQDPSESSPTDLPTKRKRGRPRKDENTAQQERAPITPNADAGTSSAAADNMIGQVVTGMIEGSFDAGYFLNVRVKDTDNQMRGVAFIPGKVIPITPENDLAPHVKMYERQENVIPSLIEQAQPEEPMNIDKQADTGSEPHTGDLAADKDKSASCMTSFAGCGAELQSSLTATDKNQSAPDEMQKISDIGPEKQALSLMPESENADGISGQHNTVQAFEASAASDRANIADSNAPKDSAADTSTPFVDFFPAPETSQQQATALSSSPNLDLFQHKTKTSESDQHKSHQYAEPHGFNLMIETQASPTENVPAELQLELGNKTISGTNASQPNSETVSSNIAETNPQSATSVSGFFANLFVGEATPAEQQETAATEASPQVATQAGDSSASTAANNDSKKVDCNMEEAVPTAQ